jgi:hypothetical protein
MPVTSLRKTCVRPSEVAKIKSKIKIKSKSKSKSKSKIKGKSKSKIKGKSKSKIKSKGKSVGVLRGCERFKKLIYEPALYRVYIRGMLFGTVLAVKHISISSSVSLSSTHARRSGLAGTPDRPRQCGPRS